MTTEIVPAGPRVVSRVAPFGMDHRTAVAQEGSTLAEMLQDSGISPIYWNSVVITVQGDPIPRNLWNRVRPKSDALVNINIVPMGGGGGGGGGGKSPLRTVLSIAVVAAAAWAAYAWGPALAHSMFHGTAHAVLTAGEMAIGQAIVGGAVSLVGGLIVNAIAPPPSPRGLSGLSGMQGASVQAPESPTLAITGARNRANAFGVIPRNFGRNRMFPTYAAQPYSENEGDDQYLYMLLDFGYGPQEISEVRIGTVAIEEFEGVEWKVAKGYPDDEQLPLYRDVTRSDSYALALTSADGAQTATTRSDTDEIGIDIRFQGLVRYDDSGHRQNQSVELLFEYCDATTETENWIAAVNTEATDTSTAWTTLAKPNGAKYQIWVTDEVVVDGNVTVTFTVPSSVAGATINGMMFAAYAREKGADEWILHKRDDSYTPAGEVKTFAISASDQRMMEIKVELIAYTLTFGTWNGENDGDAGITAIPTPTVSYKSPAAPSGPGTVKFTNNTAQGHTKAVRIKPEKRGTWKVRVTRQTKDTDDSRILDRCTLSTVRSVQYTDPTKFEVSHCLMALRIKATDQLSGVIDELNAVATSILPVWDGTSWVEQETRNPAWAYAEILRGNATRKAVDDNRLDLDGLKAWADACDGAAPTNSLPEGVTPSEDEPYWRCDLVIDWETTVWEALRSVAAVGRAAPAMKDGKFSVVRDVRQDTPVQIFTPRNSWGFTGKKTFTDSPHALRVRYVEPEKDWEQEEVVVYDDGYSKETATEFETLEMLGCTVRSQAWREGRYHMAVNRLRPEKFELSTDVENLICTRGDLVEVAHDVALTGGQWGRVIDVTVSDDNVVSFEMDEHVVFSVNKSYVARSRNNSGQIRQVPLVNPAAGVEGGSTEVNVFTLETPTPIDSAPGLGDLVVVGESELVTFEMVVKEVFPGPELTAKLILLPKGEGVHTADQGEIPKYEPDLNSWDAKNTGYPPKLATLSAEEDDVVVGNLYRYDVVLSFAVPDGYTAAAYEVYEKNGAGQWDLHGITSKRTYRIQDLDRGSLQSYLVRAVNSEGKGIALASCATTSLQIQGVTPSNVPSLSGDSRNATEVHLSWEEPADTKNLSYYQIRWTNAAPASASWESASILVSRVAQPSVSTVVTAQSGTYLIKAFDRDGAESPEPAVLPSTIPQAEGFNFVVAAEEDPLFEGVKVDCEANAGTLRLVSGKTEGTYTFKDPVQLTGTYTAKLTTDLVYGAFGAGGDFDDMTGDFDDAAGFFDAGGTTGDTEVTIEVRLDNAPDTEENWKRFTVGNYTFSTAHFRAKLKTPNADITPSVGRMRVNVDIEDRFEANNNIASDAVATTPVAFGSAFYDAPVIGVTADNMNTGDYWVISNKTASGFDIDFYDKNDNRISRTFDWLAKGGGRNSDSQGA